MIDKEVKRVDVLFNQALDLEKCRQKVPFVLDMSQILIRRLLMFYSIPLLY
jgi:hypothetical protein